MQDQHKIYKHPLELLIIQPTPFCNIDCDYCYLSNRNDTSRIDLGNLENILKKIVNELPLSNHVEVGWHAGEPLVLPATFYKKAFELFDKLIPSDIRITHHFQTNGTLIDDEWCRLFSKDNVTVALSMDGPKRFHDSHRVFRNGQGTYDAAMKGMRKIREHQIRLRVITVLSQDSLGNPDEFYEFFRENEVKSVSFNIDEKEGSNTQSSFYDANVDSLYKNFFRVFLYRRKADFLDMRIREIDHILEGILRKSDSGISNQLVQPFSIVSIDANGGFATFSPELLGESHPLFGVFRFGCFDTLGMKLDEPFFSKVFSEINSGVSMCEQECQYFTLCGGGSPVNKLYEHGTFATTETMECKFSVKLIADLLLEELQKNFLLE